MDHSLEFRISGMTCNSCASHVEKALLTVPGVHQAQVSYPEALARVSGAPALDPAMLSSAVEAAGYGVVLEKALGRLGGGAKPGHGGSGLHIAVIGSGGAAMAAA
ncbi:MAG: mercuric reductase, partial [Rhodocyclaceae bacterium]|nr:mercuric reductase [Rhodocyclaceae bacterium]